MLIIMAGGAGIQRQMVQGGTRDIQKSTLGQGTAHHIFSEDRSHHRRGNELTLDKLEKTRNQHARKNVWKLRSQSFDDIRD